MAAVPAVSNPSWSSLFETTTGKAAIAGTAVVVTWVVLTQEYTYAFALVAIGMCALLFSMRLNQSASQALSSTAQENPEADDLPSELGSRLKERATALVSRVIDLGVAAGRTAAVTFLPSSVGPAVGTSLDRFGESAKSVLGSISNASTDSMTSLTGSSAQRGICGGKARGGRWMPSRGKSSSVPRRD